MEKSHAKQMSKQEIATAIRAAFFTIYDMAKHEMLPDEADGLILIQVWEEFKRMHFGALGSMARWIIRMGSDEAAKIFVSVIVARLSAITEERQLKLMWCIKDLIFGILDDYQKAKESQRKFTEAEEYYKPVMKRQVRHINESDEDDF